MSSIWIPPRRVLLEALVLVLVAASMGLSLNHTMVMKAFTGESVAPLPNISVQGAEQQFPVPVDYEELDELLAAGQLLVDARDPQIYATAHLPGAISLPLGEADQLMTEFSAKYPYETPMIIYCNGFGCPDSFDLAVRLIAEGYIKVQVYEGGFPEWRDRGRQLEAGAP